jgi:hypothetical protein
MPYGFLPVWNGCGSSGGASRRTRDDVAGVAGLVDVVAFLGEVVAPVVFEVVVAVKRAELAPTNPATSFIPPRPIEVCPLSQPVHQRAQVSASRPGLAGAQQRARTAEGTDGKGS